jgi:hypothetical protein
MRPIYVRAALVAAFVFASGAALATPAATRGVSQPTECTNPLVCPVK